MFEVVVLCLLASAIVAYCAPAFLKSFRQLTAASKRLKIKAEIESNLFPRPTDAVLRRHYDSLVAAELENRLAQAQ